MELIECFFFHNGDKHGLTFLEKEDKSKVIYWIDRQEIKRKEGKDKNLIYEFYQEKLKELEKMVNHRLPKNKKATRSHSFKIEPSSTAATLEKSLF